MGGFGARPCATVVNQAQWWSVNQDQYLQHMQEEHKKWQLRISKHDNIATNTGMLTKIPASIASKAGDVQEN